MKKVIARIKGGLGNQLFCYAAARRLAFVNGAELFLDDKSGFVRDFQYKRNFQLQHFGVSSRIVTDAEQLGRYPRYLKKKLNRILPFKFRSYIEQEGIDFDSRLLNVQIKNTVYLDGLWQSEGYFADIKEVIRKDLTIIPPADPANLEIAGKIKNSNSVALHIRWFDLPGQVGSHNVYADYYARAIAMMKEKFQNLHFYIFSDNPESVMAKLALSANEYTLITHNKGDENAYADLWLMTLCKHIITANSTFSWWAAWLNNNPEKIIITPSIKLTGKTAWNFEGLIPDSWIKI